MAFNEYLEIDPNHTFVCYPSGELWEDLRKQLIHRLRKQNKFKPKRCRYRIGGMGGMK